MKSKQSLFVITTLVIGFVLIASLIAFMPGQAATNLVVNPGFETGSLSPWTSWNNSVVTGNAHSGTYSMRDGTAAGSGEQTITGLLANENYLLTGWVKTSKSTVTAQVGVKNFGGTETYKTSKSTSWTQLSINFTTGPSSTSATIYCYKPTTNNYVYCDDFSLTDVGSAPTPTPAPTKVLVWSDEFNDTVKDTSKWGYEIGYIRNNEAQYYTNLATNSYEDGSGVLTIKAIRESYQGYAYTSASLNTKGKASWTYGRFEMRARIPTALGTWPAWWWLGTNVDTVGWPACGEIDMMEFYRSISLYNVMDSGQHWFGYNEAFTDSTNYHVWRMEWAAANNIKLYRDDVLKLTYTGGDAAFSRPAYLLINLAIGGSQGGDPSGTTFPQYYYIDYIRIYQ